MNSSVFVPRMPTLKPTIIVLVTALLVAPMVAANQQTVVLDIKGMHCSGCASGIEAMLKRVDGVTKADVSFEERRATVEYDAAKTSPEKLIEAVEKMGYKAAPKK